MDFDEEINSMEVPVLPFLTYLNLASNNFKELPNYLYKCDKIEELIVS